MYCLIFTTFVAVLLLQAGYLYERLQSRQANEFRGNLELARAVAGTLNMFVQDVVHQELAIGINLTSMPPDFSSEQINRILEANKAALPSIRYFAWVNPQGRIIASDMPGVIDEDLAGQPFVHAISAGGEWSVSDLLSRGTDKPVFFIGRGIRDGEGRLLGIVAAAVRAEKLKGILGLHLSEKGQISIIDGSGMLVDRYPQKELKWEDRDLLKKTPGHQTGPGRQENDRHLPEPLHWRGADRYLYSESLQQLGCMRQPVRERNDSAYQITGPPYVRPFPAPYGSYLRSRIFSLTRHYRPNHAAS